MNDPQKPTELYLRFLSLVHAIRQMPQFPAMDATEEELLNAVELHRHAGRKLRVLQVMDLLPDVSPSTVHRRLKSLRHKGLISLEMDEADNRIKYVTPTDLSAQYFSKLGECVAVAGRHAAEKAAARAAASASKGKVASAA